MSDLRRPASASNPAPAPFGTGDFDDSIFEQAAKPEGGARDCDDDAEEEEPPAQREGLPPGFRMRHDSHYVEELVSRNRASRLAVAPTAAGASRDASIAQASAEIGRSLEAIGSCLHLLPRGGRTPTERVALDLIASEVTRATWLVQALSLLDGDVPVSQAPVQLATLLGRVTSALAPGWTHSGSAITVAGAADNVQARGDERLLTVAIAGMISAVQAIAERVESASIHVALRADRDRAVVEVVQDAVRVPASWRTSFFDFKWPERPGGVRASIGLAAAQRVAALHGGSLALEETDQGGCRLVLKMPRVAGGARD